MRLHRGRAICLEGDLAVLLRSLGCPDLPVSELCLGGVNFGRFCDAKQTARVVDAYRDLGGNFIDTANVYADGASEEYIGSAIASKRGDFILSTKCGLESETKALSGSGAKEQLILALDASLRRLKTDYIDIYHLHVPDPSTPFIETIAALEAFRKAGKIRHFGISNFSGWQAARFIDVCDALDASRPASLQMQYSLLVRDIEQDIVPLCVEDDVGLLAWSPLAGGLLSGKYCENEPAVAGTRMADSPGTIHRLTPRANKIIDALHKVSAEVGRPAAQIALRWVLSQKQVRSTIFGARTDKQVEQIAAGISADLPSDAIKALTDASAYRPVYPYDLQAMLGCSPRQ